MLPNDPDSAVAAQKLQEGLSERQLSDQQP